MLGKSKFQLETKQAYRRMLCFQHPQSFFIFGVSKKVTNGLTTTDINLDLRTQFCATYARNWQNKGGVLLLSVIKLRNAFRFNLLLKLNAVALRQYGCVPVSRMVTDHRLTEITNEIL
jgi:hypothetical protein